MLGRRSPSCPAAVIAAVGTIRGASKLGGRNITKYLHPRKLPCEKSFCRIDAGSRPTSCWGRPMTPCLGHKFWARGHFVSTIGRDEETIRAYIRNQEM